MTDRGQTPNDFLLGTSLLLVTIIVVFALFDPLFGPFTSPSGADNDEMADRLAERIVTEGSTTFGDRVLDLDDGSFDESSLEQLRSQAGISFRNVNVTVERSGGGVVEGIRGGPERVDEPAATATRVIKLPPGAESCQQGCFLRVEVW